MEQVTRETVEKLFKKADLDGSGTLEKSEIRKLANQLGASLSDLELDELFKTVDLDNNGSISFDEFYAWWMFGRNKNPKISKLIRIGLKGEEIAGKAKRRGSVIPSAGIENYYVQKLRVNIGEPANKTKLSLRAFIGGPDPIKQFNEGTQKYGFEENGLNFLLTLRSKNPGEGKVQLEELLENALDILEDVIPEGESFRKATKIKFFTEGEFVKIAFVCNHPLIEMTVSPAIAVADTLLPEDYTNFIGVEAELAADVKSLLEMDDSHIVREVLKLSLIHI
eukprot:TRINITY_DN977_c0_g2_i3.p1 TRINITY_DN977_c0_g2~~TRINITY_DN977_c0_g2_i3.p1  ORF type:complete len:280 (-),score=73.58 TRINITY_DN977_c0_g2_i3:67-906(-)